ncbi:MAG: hypothetical protein AB9891_21475 [Anaerolineaceae bacterium]
MAKIIYLCLRDSRLFEDFPEKIRILNRRLTPDNITPNPPVLLQNNGIKVGILNPTTRPLIRGESVCIGFPIFIPMNWWEPCGKDPDGSYALFRSNARFAEFGTDVVASRTIWFCQTDQFFIASSSQRAIVAFLGDFQVNQFVFPHMLASGVLGPENSWDKRIQYLGSDEHLLLDRQTWQITRKQVVFEMHPVKNTRDQYKQRLTTAFEEVFSEIKFDPEKWALTLSGGLDSRAILAFLKQKNIQCITWGPKASLTLPHSDPFVAQKVAAVMKAKYKFFETDIQVKENGKTILQRFIEIAEGRVDQIGAYRDGCLIWKTLFENGFVGIIRGDEFLGLKHPVTTEKKVFTDMNYHLLDDYSNLPSCLELGLKNQILPPEYAQRPNETITAWAYRIRFNIKKVDEMAALNEIKTSFLEVMNPLLSRRVIDIIKSIPYQKNPNKSIFREIVEKIAPPLEYGTSNEFPEELMREPIFQEALINGLNSPEAKKWLPGNLIDLILGKLSHTQPVVKRSKWEPLIQCAKKLIPEITVVTKFIPRKIYLDDYLLAFRAFIIVESCRLFNEDAEILKQQEN